MKRQGDLSLKISIAYLILWLFFGLFSGLLSSNKPLYANIEAQNTFPILKKEIKEFKDIEGLNAIWPLIPFNSQDLDIQNTSSKKPGTIEIRNSGKFTHYLGTDHLGRDLAAALLTGASISLQIVILSCLFAAILGVGMGLAMGYFGDYSIKSPVLNLCYVSSLAIIGFFHLRLNEHTMVWRSLIIWVLFLTLSYVVIRRLLKKKNFKPIDIPIDFILSRAIEIFDSIPKILLLIAIFAGFNPGVDKVIILIALVSWPGIAKVVRAETLKEKAKTYISAGKALGFSHMRQILFHILPNISGTIITYLTFLGGSIILIESALSFLGLGVPSDVLTWGRILAQAKSQISAWWLVFFPGFFIFASVFALNTIGRYLSQNLKSENQFPLAL